TVAGAGSVLRTDVVEDDHLVLDAIKRTLKRPYAGETYATMLPMVRKNVAYLAQLEALESWYRHARAPFFAAQEFGDLVLDGALAAITSARRERASRLVKLAAKLPGANETQQRTSAAMADVVAVFGQVTAPPETLAAELRSRAEAGTGYLASIHALEDKHVATTKTWLQEVVDSAYGTAVEILPDLAD
ncbi:MAG: UDP-N-acetylglucosamine pyrophosphorylase, partial [Mobilicoccus sp.]|nr:UDP-N-acetylglucosamine pyrophosphorylase [Mobilicoccus sp.]